MRTSALLLSAVLLGALACDQHRAEAHAGARDRDAPLASPSTLDLAERFAPYEAACFVVLDLESGRVRRWNPEQAATPLSPCSTFKIPNALIGLETGALAGTDQVLPWDGTTHERVALNRDHDLRSAMDASVVWYFQEVARRVGTQRMAGFLASVGYGNQDISGGLTQFWLESSLKISADEQVAFLARMLRGELPVSDQTVQGVTDILEQRREGDVVLFGKTGSGHQSLGWFVGWLTRPGGTSVFACNVESTGVYGRDVRALTEQALEDLALLPPEPGR